ncbi:MAG: RAMP superfamily CRISPR-associated protein [Candidatus Promineifilaceae bacterium]
MRTDFVQVTYELHFQTPFHFGTGFRKGMVHRSISRAPDGFLYVPGSTFKGVVRERCEQLARLFELGTHEPHSGLTTGAKQPKGNLSRNILAEFSPRQTIVNRIFGSRRRPSQLYFDDALMFEEDKTLFTGLLEKQVQTRTQVSMSRRTGTAKQGALYTSEYGQRLRFTGMVNGFIKGYDFLGESDGSYSLLLLLMGISIVDRLGGQKSGGAGLVDCRITGLSINDVVQQPNDWFEELEYLEFYREEQDA